MKNIITYATTDVLYNILMSAIMESKQKEGKKIFYTLASDYQTLKNLVNADAEDIYGDFYTIFVKTKLNCTKIILEQAEITLFSMRTYDDRQSSLAIQTLISYVQNHFHAIVKGKY